MQLSTTESHEAIAGGQTCSLIWKHVVLPHDARHHGQHVCEGYAPRLTVCQSPAHSCTAQPSACSAARVMQHLLPAHMGTSCRPHPAGDCDPKALCPSNLPQLRQCSASGVAACPSNICWPLQGQRPANIHGIAWPDAAANSRRPACRSASSHNDTASSLQEPSFVRTGGEC